MRLQTNKPIGVNFLIPFLEIHTVEAAATGARVIEFFYGEPDAALVKVVHGLGALGELANRLQSRKPSPPSMPDATSSSRKALREGATSAESCDCFRCSRRFWSAVRIPVLASGGIATAKQVAAILATGADGVFESAHDSLPRQSPAPIPIT